MFVVQFDFFFYELPGQVFGSFFCLFFFNSSQKIVKHLKRQGHQLKLKTNKDEHKIDEPPVGIYAENSYLRKLVMCLIKLG